MPGDMSNVPFDEIKTKKFQEVLDNLKVSKALVIIEDNDQNVVLSARNIPDVKTALVNTINVFDILKYDSFVVSKAAVEKIQEVYV